jgi:hypothetical protein
MGWGMGSNLGVLAMAGYIVFVAGAAHLWHNRADVPVWLHDETAALRRRFARHVAIAGFGSLREESRWKLCPGRYLRHIGGVRRRRINRGAILLLVGPLLLLLDFFV